MKVDQDHIQRREFVQSVLGALTVPTILSIGTGCTANFDKSQSPEEFPFIDPECQAIKNLLIEDQEIEIGVKRLASFVTNRLSSVRQLVEAGRLVQLIDAKATNFDWLKAEGAMIELPEDPLQDLGIRDRAGDKLKGGVHGNSLFLEVASLVSAGHTLVALRRMGEEISLEEVEFLSSGTIKKTDGKSSVAAVVFPYLVDDIKLDQLIADKTAALSSENDKDGLIPVE